MREHLSKILSVSAVMGLLAAFTMGVQAPPSLDYQAVSAIVEYRLNDNPTVVGEHGSGVFINERQVLTAAHVIKRGVKDEVAFGQVRLKDGDIYHIKKVEEPSDMDVAIITLDRPLRSKVTFPKIACTPTVPGNMYRTVGSPLGIEFIDLEIRSTGGGPDTAYSVTQNEGRNGKVVDPNGTNEQQQAEVKPKFKVIPPDEQPKGEAPAPEKVVKEKEFKLRMKGTSFFQGPALPGSSGSPIYDEHGNIRGVLVITVYDNERTSYSGLGLYVETATACKWIQKHSGGDHDI